MRPITLIFVALCFALVSCGGGNSLSQQPEIRTVAYAGSDWQASDLEVRVAPSGSGWHVDVTSTAKQPAHTLLLELRFDKELVAQGAQTMAPQSDLSLLAQGNPGGIGLGVVMPKGESIQPGALLSFNLAPAGHAALSASNADYVGDLTGSAQVGQDDLSWSYHLSGDYDQNSEVNIADLTALGPRLGHSTSDGDDDAADAVVDGDGNGQITIADVTPIGANFLKGIASYNVYSQDGAQVSTSAGNVLFNDSIKTGAVRTFSFSVTDAARITDANFFVRAVYSDSTEGSVSNVLHLDPVVPHNYLFDVPPAGQSTVDNALSLDPSLALLTGDGADINDGAPLVAYTTTAGELRLGYYRGGSWQYTAINSGTAYALPHLLVLGTDWYVIAVDTTQLKVVRLHVDSSFNVLATDDIATLANTPTQMVMDYFPDLDVTAIATGALTGGGYEVDYASNSSGSFASSVVSTGADTLAGLTLKLDPADGEPWLFFTHGTIDTSTSFTLSYTLERAQLTQGTWSTAPVAYPDSPLALDLMFKGDGTPQLAFTAARDTTLPIPGNPLTLTLDFDGVVGTYSGGNWSFAKYYTSNLGFSLGGGFPPTTITLNMLLDLENHWAREGELSYTVANGGLTFDISTLAPSGGSLAPQPHYSVANGAAYADSSYFTGLPGLSQSWGEHGSVHGAAYTLAPALDFASLSSGNIDTSASVLFWRK